LSKNIFKEGQLVRIKALPGIYKTSFYDRMIGIIIRCDPKESLYVVLVDEKEIQLTFGEMELIES